MNDPNNELAQKRLRAILGHLTNALDEACIAQDEQTGVDWGWVGTFKHTANQIQQIISCDDGQGGLRALVKKMPEPS